MSLHCALLLCSLCSTRLAGLRQSKNSSTEFCKPSLPPSILVTSLPLPRIERVQSTRRQGRFRLPSQLQPGTSGQGQKPKDIIGLRLKQ